jgi:hypothetical protein
MNNLYPFSADQAKKIFTHFNLSVAPRPHFFEKVFQYKLENCDENFSENDFFNYFYIENDSILSIRYEIN